MLVTLNHMQKKKPSIYTNTGLEQLEGLKIWGNTNRFLGCFKSAKNFICQKVQKFWADSGYVGKINNKKFSKIFFVNV